MVNYTSDTQQEKHSSWVKAGCIYLSWVKAGYIYLSWVKAGYIYLSWVKAGCICLSWFKAGCIYLSWFEGPLQGRWTQKHTTYLKSKQINTIQTSLNQDK
jgi:hypothetical protein